MKKHSRIINKILLILIAAAVIGCGRESRRTDYVARVNNSYLTEKDIDRIINSTPGKNFFRNEIIRNWINREIIFQKAVKEGIINDDEYKRIIEDSKKELAASILLEQIYNDEKISVTETELTDFYKLSNEDFRLTENHYLLNRIRFKNEDNAVSFRNIVIDNNWEEALEDNDGNSAAGEKGNSLFVSEHEIHPVSVLRIVKELYPGETSIVINETPEDFTIVQMLQKYDEGTIPPQALITETLRKRILQKKKEELIKNYIKDLYSDYEIEIKQE